MAQTRVVISDRLRPIAEELQVVTGVSSLSDVVALLLTKYAQHLKTSWIESGMQNLSFRTNTLPVQQQVQLAEPVYEPQYPQPGNSQLIELSSELNVQLIDTTPEPEIDPVIARLTPLLDRF